MAIYAKGGALPATIRLSLAAAAIALPACSMSQATPTVSATAQTKEGPAIWTLADDDTTIHLFGYTQVLKAGETWENDRLKTLIAAADLVVMENDPGDQKAQMAVQQLVPQIGLNRDGLSLSSMLSEEDAAALKSAAEGLGLPMQAIDSMKPWLASIQLGAVAVGQQGYDLQSNLAAQIASLASDAGKPIRALEQPVELMRIVAALPRDVQLGMLMHTIDDIRTGRDRSAPVNAAWQKGDVATVGSLLHGEGSWSSRTDYDAMLVQRNAAWADTIKKLLTQENGVVVIAIGLGHLAGPDSLQSMLAEEGIQVRRL